MSLTPPSPASTYYRAGPGLRLFRAALAACERLWPALAVRLASLAFLTPLPLRPLLPRGRWPAGWRIEQWDFEDASVTVYSPAAGPRGPAALLVHGWGGDAVQMRPLAEAIAARGLTPLIVDMPAHGRSRGRTSALPQFARAIDYVAARLQQQGFELRALVAHSLGANAAAYATSRGLAAQRLVLLAPPASPPEYTRLFAQAFGLSEPTRAAMQRRIEARQGMPMPLFEPAAVGARVQVPTLVVHDRGDMVNRFADGEAFARAIRGSRMLPTAGLGHRRMLGHPQVLGEVADFVA
jgi:pimeloyl-ACP methyl ester carboxylesterase